MNSLYQLNGSIGDGKKIAEFFKNFKYIVEKHVTYFDNQRLVKLAYGRLVLD